MSEKWARWYREELAILKKCYPNTPREDLMRLLPGRTWRAIVNQSEKQKIHRPHYGIARSKEYLAELHTTLSNARTNRTSGYAPFAGKRHSVEAKLAIGVTNLHTRGHCSEYIARAKGITEKEVGDIIENRNRKNK